MRVFGAYAIAAAIGIATPIFVLAIARETPVGSDPAFVGAAVVLGLGVAGTLLAAFVPRHWLALALIVSVPLGLLGTVMFAVLANVGEFFWIWLWIALGSVAAALAGAVLAARAMRR